MFRTSSQLGRIFRSLATARQFEEDQELWVRTLFLPIGAEMAGLPPTRHPLPKLGRPYPRQEEEGEIIR